MSSWDMIDSNITISVLMPAYNAAEYIREAIDSILNQTFTNFEFVIINDGSTDATEDVILNYSDERIQYYANECNMGIVKTLNRGIDLCRGKYIARMDADDISYPERLRKQMQYMEANPHVVACGCLYAIYGKEHLGAVDVATSAEDIRMETALYCQFAHSTLMMRKSILEENSLRYRDAYRHAEDYKLWTELLGLGDMINLPEVLHAIRQCEEGISIVYSKEQKQMANQVRKDYLKQMGIDVETTLNDLQQQDMSLSKTTEVLDAYLPLIRQCDKNLWIRKNYVSTIKQMLKKINRFERVEMIKRYNSVLSTKDKIAILIK